VGLARRARSIPAPRNVRAQPWSCCKRSRQGRPCRWTWIRECNWLVVRRDSADHACSDPFWLSRHESHLSTHARPTRPISKAKASGWETGFDFLYPENQLDSRRIALQRATRYRRIRQDSSSQARRHRRAKRFAPRVAEQRHKGRYDVVLSKRRERV